MSLVTDDMVEAALAAIGEDEAKKAASAAADLVRAEAKTKRVLSELRRRAPAACTSNPAKEDWARAHCDHIEAVEEEAEARGRVEYHRATRTGAIAIIDAWRSEQASARGAQRIG